MTRVAAARADLSERMRSVCANAVDPLEIAAALEAEGVTDAVAANRYGTPDVFQLADRLWRECSSRPEPASLVRGPWRSRPGQHLARGLLFALPAACYLSVASAVSDPTSGLVVVVSLILSWAAAQALSYLGYSRLGIGDVSNADKLLRGALLRWGTAAAVAVVAVAVVLQVPVTVGVMAVGQAGYLVAAAVALVREANRALFGALVPGVAGNILAAVLGGSTQPGGRWWQSVAAICSVVTVVATVGVALRCTAGAGLGLAPRGRELAGAIPQALYGLFAGGVIGLPAIVQALAPNAIGRSAGGAAATLLPLTASMGVAEWLLYRYRADNHRAMQRAVTLARFRLLASAALGRAVLAYLVVLVAGMVLTGWLIALATATTTPVTQLAGATVLGGALFVALVLLSFGLRAIVVASYGIALAVETAFVAAQTGDDRPAVLAIVQLATAGSLFVLLLAVALAALSGISRHR
jgi:hypothetical protein